MQALQQRRRRTLREEPCADSVACHGRTRRNISPKIVSEMTIFIWSQAADLRDREDSETTEMHRSVSPEKMISKMAVCLINGDGVVLHRQF